MEALPLTVSWPKCSILAYNCSRLLIFPINVENILKPIFEPANKSYNSLDTAQFSSHFPCSVQLNLNLHDLTFSSMQDTIKQLCPMNHSCHKTQPHVILANQRCDLIFVSWTSIDFLSLGYKRTKILSKSSQSFLRFFAAGHSPDCK